MKYFKHMTNMRHDVKIKRLISRYGIEGYGLYNLMLEAIAEKLETDSPVPDLQETCEDMADFYNGNTAKINEMANFMINQGLFELDEVTGHMLCQKVYKFLEASQTRSAYLRQMIKAYKHDDGVSLLSETVSDKSEEENRIEKNRKEQKRKASSSIEGFPINQTTHDKLVEEYGISTILHYYTTISDYVSSKGKKDYADYSATARQWIKRDIEQGKGPKKKTKPKPMDEIELAIYNRQMEEGER